MLTVKNNSFITCVTSVLKDAGGNVKGSYQEDLRAWVIGPEGGQKASAEERRQWTKTQVEQIAQKPCTLPELEAVCKKKGILIWSVKYYAPDFYRAVIEKSKTCAVQEIIEEIGTEWCSPPPLRALIKQKNEEYSLTRYRREISYNDLKEYDPQWFHAICEQRYITLPDIIKGSHPPRFQKVSDKK